MQITHPVKDGKKVCIKCLENKPIEEFYQHKKLSKHIVQAKCIACYKLVNYSTKTNSIKIKKYHNERKDKLVLYKGGKCEVCGVVDDSCVFDFHHLDSSKKDFSISGRVTSKWSLVIEEADKCLLVCANCHRKIHKGGVGHTMEKPCVTLL